MRHNVRFHRVASAQQYDWDKVGCIKTESKDKVKYRGSMIETAARVKFPARELAARPKQLCPWSGSRLGAKTKSCQTLRPALQRVRRAPRAAGRRGGIATRKWQNQGGPLTPALSASEGERGNCRQGMGIGEVQLVSSAGINTAAQARRAEGVQHGTKTGSRRGLEQPG